MVVKGKRPWSLFDTGSVNSYIVKKAVNGFPVLRLPKPRKTALGGGIKRITKGCWLYGTIEGRQLEIEAYVTNAIGADEAGREIELLFGALMMQKWNIKIDPRRGKLDLSHFVEEFVEFLGIDA